MDLVSGSVRVWAGVALAVGVGGWVLDVGLAPDVGVAPAEAPPPAWPVGVADEDCPGGGLDGDPGAVDGVGTAPDTSGVGIVAETLGAVDPTELSNPVALGEGIGLPRPPTAMTVAVVAVSAPAPIQEPTLPSSLQRRPTAGIWAIHAPMPIVFQRFPEEILRKARTIAGSNWVPATSGQLLPRRRNAHRSLVGAGCGHHLVDISHRDDSRRE